MSPDLVFSRIQRRPCYHPLYVLEALYIVRTMVCSAAFLVVLVTTLLGTQSSSIEEASSFSTSENFLLQYTPRKWIQLCKLRPRVLREITVVRLTESHV